MKKNYRIITTKDNKSIKKVLRNTSGNILEITDEIRYLIQRMKEIKTNIGIGIAAPQLGENINVIVVDDLENGNKRNIVLINPMWINLSEEKKKDEELCLSVPRQKFMKERYVHIKVWALDENMNPIEFEAKDLFARVIQHECDHLIGKLICDYEMKKAKVFYKN